MDPKRRKTEDFPVEGLNFDEMELPQHHEYDAVASWRQYPIRTKARALNRRKDFVCLILSYPPLNSENREGHRGWILDVLEVNRKLRQLEAHSKVKEMDISRLEVEINGLMNHSIHDIEEYYVLPYTIEKMPEGTIRFPGLDKVRDLAVDFTLRQILQAIEISEFQTIEITANSGISDAARLMSALKNLPPIREMFDVVIHVVPSCSSYLTVEDIEHSIMTELGFSRLTIEGAAELLKSKNFLILLEGVSQWIDLNKLGSNWWNLKNTQKIVWSTPQIVWSTPQIVRSTGYWRSNEFAADLKIRLKDHLISWEFLSINVRAYALPSHVKRLSIGVLKESCGHLLAIVLMAKSLKGVHNVHVWEDAYYTLGLPPTSQVEDRILFNALRFIWGRLDSVARECMKYCTLYLEKEGTDKVELIQRWIKNASIGTLDEGEKVLQDLVNIFLLESLRNGDSVRMRDKIRKEFVYLFRTDANIIIHRLDGRGLREAPKDEAWEEANEMHLMNNKISKLGEFPNCPKLRRLFLQGNNYLRVIPPFFFQCMPVLQILDLSHTRIRTLPPSLFKLVQLRKFFLRGCELFMELPPEIGELHYLEVLDLERTEIKNLPAAVGNLTNLRRLRLSFYGYDNNRKNNHSDRLIPENVISSLLELEELSVDVNPEDERWNLVVKDVIKEVCSLNHLEVVELYLPEAVLLNELNLYMSKIHFRFTVGSQMKRIVSRPSPEPAVKFKEQERCLRYVNGEGVPTEIERVLFHTTVFLLDRHSTVTSLSEFGRRINYQLKCCVLRECTEIETIVDANNETNDALGSLQYLTLHYMKKLRSIWGPRYLSFSSSLKSLELYTCPRLTTIFTLPMLENVCNLEELVVEDCPEINSIVSLEIPPEDQRLVRGYLPSLKKISLHYMPNLASISKGLRIAPELQWMSFYNCPKLKTLSKMEVHSNDLRVIIGEADWWNALKWSESEWIQQPLNLDSVFVPIESYTDLMSHLAEVNNQVQAQMQELNPSEKSGPGDSKARSSSKQRQVV